MTRLKQRNNLLDLQILDNEASADYKVTMQDIWNVDYQLIPTNFHIRNAAELTIHTFKTHFLSILAGIAEDFPKNLWDLLIHQTEMMLNLLRQSTLKSDTSALAHFNGIISYNNTHLCPLGCKVIMHKKN